MPTQNQIDQAAYLAMKSKQTGDMPPLVAGQPVASAEEGKQAADIAGLNVPSAGGVIRGMVTPYNLVTTAAEAAGTAMGGPVGGVRAGRLAQPVATAAQRLSEGKPVFSMDTVKDTAWNAAVNEVGKKIGEYVVGPVASYVGQSAPVQAFRSAFAKRVVGKISPDARAAYEFSGEMINDAMNAVNNVRAQQGKPLYTRDEVEKRLGRHIENLSKRGVFTIPDLTAGGLVDAMEPLAEGSIAGKGTFGSKRSDQDALLQEWPKVWAGMLGDEISGPDEMAALASMAIEGSLRTREKAAGGLMGSVQDVVGSRVVPIDETLLDSLQSQVSNYAKRYQKANGAGEVKIDPEGLDQHIKSAISLVERATGKKFNLETGAFDTVLPKGLAGMPPQVIAALQAQGKLPTSTKIPFTFEDVKTMQSNLGRMAEAASGDKRQADAALTTLRGALKSKMNEVLDAEDKLNGKFGAPDSLRNLWRQGSEGYERAQQLRSGFDAQGWIESLKQAGNGRAVIPKIWPDNADINRIENLKELMGGENSPYWNTLKRFKMEDMIDTMTSGAEPGDKLYKHLTDYKVHSREYWDATLGKDQYERILKFANVLKEGGKKNPFSGEAGLTRRIDAGFAMRVADPSVGKAALTSLATTGAGGLALGAAGAAASGAGIAGYMVSARKVAQWLTNPEDSAMFAHVYSGKPLTMKARTWLKNQVGRAIADAAKDEQPDIVPIPTSATREQLKQRGAGYNGIRG